MSQSILAEKSFRFAVDVVRLCQRLSSESKEFVLSKQLLRSGTAIGALVSEARFGQSLPDFISKLSIAAKEASETDYWLKLLRETGYLSTMEYNNTTAQVDELLRMLSASIKTAKSRLAP